MIDFFKTLLEIVKFWKSLSQTQKDKIREAIELGKSGDTSGIERVFRGSDH